MDHLNSYASTLSPKHHSNRFVELDSSDGDGGVHLGNQNITFTHQMLIILGISLCTMCLYFVCNYHKYKSRKMATNTEILPTDDISVGKPTEVNVKVLIMIGMNV